MTKADDPKDDEIPALFATIHFRSKERPDGYTSEEITEMNRLANAKRKEFDEGEK